MAVMKNKRSGQGLTALTMAGDKLAPSPMKFIGIILDKGTLIRLIFTMWRNFQ
jgi:hypothetical protein